VRLTVAFSLSVLQLFQAIQEHGKCSKEAFAMGLLAYLEVKGTRELSDPRHKHHLADAFNDAHAHSLTIDALARIESFAELNVLHKALVRSDTRLSYQDTLFRVKVLHEMCPACFGWTLKNQ